MNDMREIDEGINRFMEKSGDVNHAIAVIEQRMTMYAEDSLVYDALLYAYGKLHSIARRKNNGS